MNILTRRLLIVIFFASGFSGLIYESIWSHYLKLFLGHAAYAQTLVLIIFMGGLAIGSWLSTQVMQSKKINLLLAYAVVEALVGILAIFFHYVFVNVSSFSFDIIIPQLKNPLAVNIYKWLLGSLLITPQSILLGATFPLMSAGFNRYSPKNGGNIALLYFVNSLGACLGVLASGFLLIKMLGLPGTILTAGLINIFLAVLTWVLVRAGPLASENIKIQLIAPTKETNRRLYQIMLITAALTGTASFIYEVVWIRMLSLVLGSSTHAFELMLSAFILGLALGSFYIKQRINTLAQPLRSLGKIQLVMAVLAVSSVLLYNSCFEFMQFLMKALQKTAEGYVLFNISSHILACLIMLPATFCAGMTLPLITKIALDNNSGERSIGHVYAINTLGAILGVILTIHYLLPYVGLKNALVTGAVIDLILAVIILSPSINGALSFSEKLFLTSGALVILLIALFGSFNQTYMASGVFRYGTLQTAATAKFLYHHDGKTATVDVISNNSIITIMTNGKPDAGISIGVRPSPDESTTRLLAFIPLSMLDKVSDVAIIGMGSGLTTDSALAFDELKNVDTIEIEPGMVEGSRFFGKQNQRAFSDPRSHIYIDDAKTFFTSHNKKYDLIISEPSNPWVSGVSSLFSDEFYSHINRHLTEEGIFSQWIQIYEINDELVGSIFKSISESFSDYHVYRVSNYDLVVVAKPHGTLGNVSDKLFSVPAASTILKKIGTESLADIEVRYLGNKEFFSPYLGTLGLPKNSDFFPVVDQNAAKTRFMNQASDGFINKDGLLNLMGHQSAINPDDLQKNMKYFIYNPSLVKYMDAAYLNTEMHTNDSLYEFNNDEGNMLAFKKIFQTCVITEEWIDAAFWFSSKTIPYMTEESQHSIWNKITSQKCFARNSEKNKLWLDVFQNFSERKYHLAISSINKLSHVYNKAPAQLNKHSFYVAMLYISYIQQQQYNDAMAIWSQLSAEQKQDETIKFLMATAVAMNPSNH